MENENSEKTAATPEKYSFLKDKQAASLFGKLDYELKVGRHIQYQHPDQEEYFNFIRRNYHPLKEYYQDFFSVILDSGGIEGEIYYYIDFEVGTRGNIPADKREFLNASDLIIGIFACKVYNIDFHPEVSSLKTFKHLMMEEYEEYKNDFYRLLAQVRDSEKELHMGEDETELENAIKSAFREFDKLGWVYFTDDAKENFHILPAFERLRKLYQQEINSPRQLAEKYRK